jgi:hypothetical protein
MSQGKKCSLLKCKLLWVATILVIATINVLSGCVSSAPATTAQGPSQTSQPTERAPQPSIKAPVELRLGIEQLGTAFTVTNTHPEMRELQTLRCVLSPGDRVEGVVLADAQSAALSTVYDPYGNIAVQSSRRVDTSQVFSDGSPRVRTTSTQKYPWKFAFIATTQGEYYLYMIATKTQNGQSWPANVTLTIYAQ